MKQLEIKIDYEDMIAYICKNAEEDCGAVFGLDGFISGVSDPIAQLHLRDLCVEYREGVYTLLEYQETWFDYIDDTRSQTLEKLLKSVLSDVVEGRF